MQRPASACRPCALLSRFGRRAEPACRLAERRGRQWLPGFRRLPRHCRAGPLPDGFGPGSARAVSRRAAASIRIPGCAIRSHRSHRVGALPQSATPRARRWCSAPRHRASRSFTRHKLSAGRICALVDYRFQFEIERPGEQSRHRNGNARLRLCELKSIEYALASRIKIHVRRGSLPVAAKTPEEHTSL